MTVLSVPSLLNSGAPNEWVYLTESVFKVVLQGSIFPQILQSILYYYQYKE